jgi:hypothetical protein
MLGAYPETPLGAADPCSKLTTGKRCEKGNIHLSRVENYCFLQEVARGLTSDLLRTQPMPYGDPAGPPGPAGSARSGSSQPSTGKADKLANV